MEDLRSWKKTCSGEFFAKLIGYCDSADSLLPASVLEAKNYANAYLRKEKNIRFFDFVCIFVSYTYMYIPLTTRWHAFDFSVLIWFRDFRIFILNS